MFKCVLIALQFLNCYVPKVDERLNVQVVMCNQEEQRALVYYVPSRVFFKVRLENCKKRNVK